MTKVVITGVETPLGGRVAALAAADPGTEVVGLASRPVAGLPAEVVVRRADLVHDDVKGHLERAGTVMHLAQSAPETPVAATGDAAAARRLLDAAGAAGVDHLVVLSSATVYGAWANNPVPLTEDAALRPNPGFPFGAERAEIERLTAEWRHAHPGTTAAVLRPVRVAAPGPGDWLVRVLRPGPAVPDSAEDPPAQFVDLDDVAAACELARARRLDGAFNVAPEGSIPGDQVRSLTGAPPRVPLPDRVARRFARWGLGRTPAALLPYTLHPWVVAADRLRAQGWVPRASNEEACVDAHDVGPWATMSPRRRQEVALGAAGAGLLVVAAAAAAAARRWLRR
jgi:nucleoside-diphosphate-sugar epimerase